MTRVLTIVAVFVIVVGSGLVVKIREVEGVEAHGEGAGFREAASENGDVNCDGEVQLSDAVYTLNWLFLGGRAPCPIADPPELLERIAELEGEVAEGDARIVELEAEVARLQGELAATGVELSECFATIEQVEDSLNEAQVDLVICREEFVECEGRLESCSVGPERCRQSFGSRELPATGQTLCLAGSIQMVDCNDGGPIPVVHEGQDGFYQAGCPKEGRFVSNGDGTVTDTCTGLMWETGTTQTVYGWDAALEHCEALELAGYDDWRLPNVRELQSIVDYGECLPAIDESAFQSFSDFYWSSSGRMCSPFQAWKVSFANGEVILEFDDVFFVLHHVRAVRGPAEAFGWLPDTGQVSCYDSNGNEIDCNDTDWPGQDGFYQLGCPMDDRFTDNDDGTVLDRCTGLVWTKDPLDTNGDKRPDSVAWQQALQFCGSLEFAGHSDWRLPNIRELYSIADYSGSRLPSVFLPNIDNNWSSTTLPSTQAVERTLAKTAGFSIGSIHHSNKTTGLWEFRAVRGPAVTSKGN
jgi:hypothetical protein